MELVNRTPVPASLVVAELAGAARRLGLVTAKATFRFDLAGRVALDTQEPVPFLSADEETPFGLMPRDDLPRRDDAFEVVVLGNAVARGGTPVPEVLVTLSVGQRTRRIVATGDRVWSSGSKASEPAPFVAMPLSFERAFGGTAEVLVDERSPVDVSHSMNPNGRGFDPGPQAWALGTLLRCPSGYPRWGTARPLPNLEHPDDRVRRPSDAPRPYAWSAVPMDTGLHALRSAELPPEGAPFPPSAEALRRAARGETLREGLFHRAHPDWVMEVPEREALVSMDGLFPEGPASFHIPPVRVVSDSCVGGATGTLPLLPQVLVLLTEERRFTLLFRAAFTVGPPSGTERSLRLRLEEGWDRPASRS